MDKNNYKKDILDKLCYTELVYSRINKKLNIVLSKDKIEELILNITLFFTDYSVVLLLFICANQAIELNEVTVTDWFLSKNATIQNTQKLNDSVIKSNAGVSLTSLLNSQSLIFFKENGWVWFHRLLLGEPPLNKQPWFGMESTSIPH
jgi:hypothetical protein